MADLGELKIPAPMRAAAGTIIGRDGTAGWLGRGGST